MYIIHLFFKKNFIILIFAEILKKMSWNVMFLGCQGSTKVFIHQFFEWS